MILFNDELTESRMASMDKYVCHVISRKDESLIKELSDDFSRPALYVLVNRMTKHAYVGQTDNFSQRISQHIAKKDFWTEFIVFTANDNSLTTTEVKYLEAEAYECAENKHNYDLSENGQKPCKPHATSIQKINIKEFFKNAVKLAKLLGCDIFEFGKAVTSMVVNDQSTILNIDTKKLKVKSDDLSGKCKLSLLGSKPMPKNKFAHAIIKQFIKENPTATLADIKKAFPDSLLGGWNRWPLIQDDIERAENYQDYGELKKRHLLEDEYRLRSADGIEFVVCTEWDKNNILNLLAIADSCGWNYTIIK